MVQRILLLLALLIGSAGVSYVQAAVYSGNCGPAGYEANVTWELNTETGRLEISGSGPMTHYWSLTDIPWYNYRQYVTSITMRYGVTTIGHHAFYDFPNVTDISCDYVTSIGVLSFGFCRKITSLEIPASVTSIGDQALWYNESLKEVHVEWTGDAVPTMPSNIHNFDASKIYLHIPCGQTAAYTAKGWDTKFTLIEGLDGGLIKTTTNNFLWTLSCDSVWTVSGTGALKDFPNPLYVDLGIARVTTNISSLSPVFSKRKVVKGAVFEEGITYIGNNTLYKGTYHAGYPYLTTLTLPSTLTSMSSTAFTGCIALKDVYVSWTTAAAIPTWNQSIDVSQATLHVPCGTKSLYQAKSGWNGFNIKEERGHGTCGANGDNLTWLLSCNGTLTISGTGAMYNWMTLAERPWHSLCTSIQRVVLEEGVTTTGYHAFYGASNLTSVSLPSTLQTLQWMTFFGCGKLTTLTIPSSVTYVGNRSLEGCSALTDVYTSWTGDAMPTMPPGIHTYDASRIRLHIPCGQTAAYVAKGWNTKFTLNDGSVSGTCGANGDNLTWLLSCDGVLTISGSGAMADWSSSDKVPWYSYRSSITTVNIRDGVTSVGNRAFIECTALTSVTIPNSVTSISNNAFFSCSALANIAIPNSVTTIGQYVFYGCSALTNITIPNSVTSLGENIFRNCSALTDIYVSWASPIPDWPTDFTNKSPQSSITLHVPCGTGDVYAAQDGWKDYTIVANLPRVLSGTCGAVGNVANVTWSLNLCDSTLTISGTGAMRSWTSASKVPWKDYRDNIQHIVIEDGVTSIGQNAFSNCTNVTSLSIGSDVTSIGTTAFYYCTALENIIIPDNVRSIGYMAFGYCSGASTLTIGAGVNSIDQYAFISGSSLTSIVIPDNVQTLGNYAFAGCEDVSSVTIGTGVNSIGDYVFALMPNITDMYVGWTTADAIPAWTTGFTQVSPQSDITLHVPCSAMSLYQAADGWKDYTIEGEGGPYTITVESDDLSMGTVDARKL